jgi:hypothetical protein
MMPRRSGREVLAEMKARDLHATCYITKPIDGLHPVKVAKAIEGLWPTIVRLPFKEPTP